MQAATFFGGRPRSVYLPERRRTAFLSDERRAMRREFENEIDALAAGLEDLPPEALAYFREAKG